MLLLQIFQHGWKFHTVTAEMHRFAKTFFFESLAIVLENSNFGLVTTNFPISRKCKNFNFSFSTVPAEMLVSSKVFGTNFQKHFFGWRMIRTWLLWLKISSAQIFWFCNSNVTTFPISRKCKNFNFSFYTVPAEMLYLQKYLTNFQKHFFGWKMRNGGYCGWKFQVHRYFGFAIATLQLFQYPENVKISIFPFTLSQQKC